MKNYKMTVAKNGEGKDVFLLLDDDSVVSEISLGKNEGASELRDMFTIILESLITDDVKITYTETANYPIRMYKDVCKAYVEILQKEIDNASQSIKSEGIRIDKVQDA